MDTLASDLDQNVQANLKPIAIETLADKGQLSLGRIVKLLDNPTHGPVIASITIDDLVNYRIANMGRDALISIVGDVEVEEKSKTAKRKTTKAKAAKTTKAKEGGRAKLDRDAGYAVITKALKSAGEAIAMGFLVEETGLNEGHARTMLKEMVEEGTVVAEGNGRGRKYSLA